MTPRREEPVPQPPNEPSYIPEVATFDGTNPPCSRFLFQIDLSFLAAPSRFSTEISKCMYLLSLTRGVAQEWAYSLVQGDRSYLEDFGRLSQALKTNFEAKGRAQLAMCQLSVLRQGTDSVEEYTHKFNQISSGIKWCDLSLIHHFYFGLSEPIKDKMTGLDYPDTLREMISLATAWGERLEQRTQEKKLEAKASSTHHRPAPPPREDQKSLPDFWNDLSEERKTQITRMAKDQCMRCGSPEHIGRDCPRFKRKEVGKDTAQSQK
jgi:retrotransposon gag protein